MSAPRKLLKKFRHWLQVDTTPEHLESIYHSLIEESSLDLNFIVLILGSAIIATLGLLSNSPAVIIGAMLVAPLMFPIRGIAFGAIGEHIALWREGLISLVVGTSVALILACAIGLVVGIPEFGSEVIARSKPNLLDLGIAVTAGGISGFAKVEPKISGTLAGTAIAVALMPPVCVIGLGLSQGNWGLSLGATLLYLTNLFGITLSCMIAFLATGCSPLRRARKALTWASIFTALLLIPLGVSFWELVRQARLEASLKRALLNRTITFQRVELSGSNIDWLIEPPIVYLSVNSPEPLTPRQVTLLEEFVRQEMGQPFTLIFKVNRFEEVRRQKS